MTMDPTTLGLVYRKLGADVIAPESHSYATPAGPLPFRLYRPATTTTTAAATTTRGGAGHRLARSRRDCRLRQAAAGLGVIPRLGASAGRVGPVRHHLRQPRTRRRDRARQPPVRAGRRARPRPRPSRRLGL